jgi:uncharacterized iron-regulated membrane protein
MSLNNNHIKITKTTRWYRKLHKWAGVPLFLFLFLTGLSGLLLGWKKQSGLLPSTQKGASLQSAQWISVDSMLSIVSNWAQAEGVSARVDRIDIRPDKGIAKMLLSEAYLELQIDCSNGQIKSVSTRHSDWIENLHDGSILDRWLGLPADAGKLSYSTLGSLGLMLLSFSGFWLWYNPIRLRKSKEKSGGNAVQRTSSPAKNTRRR